MGFLNVNDNGNCRFGRLTYCKFYIYDSSRKFFFFFFFFWGVKFSILQNIPNMYLILLPKKMKTNKLKKQQG